MKFFLRINIFILAFVFCALSFGKALAAGCAYKVRNGVGILLNAEMQYAQIEYLSLAAEFSNMIKVEKAVWIFPVPAKPEKIKIDISSEVTLVDNSCLTVKKKSKIFLIDHFIWMCASQIYPLLVFDINAYLFDDELYRHADERKELERQKIEARPYIGVGYTIHKATSKYNLNTELVSLENLHGLTEYLEFRKLKLPYDIMKMTSEYTDKGYSFVVSWYTEPTAFNFYTKNIFGSNNMLDVKINFETSKIFFPLKLTSIYGNNKIPVNITVNGLVTPYLYPEIIIDSFKGKKVSQVEYYIDSTAKRTDFFYGGYLKIVPSIYQNAYDALMNSSAKSANKYTRILIDAPAKNYIDDLWMSPLPPYRLMFLDFMLDYNFFSFLMYFVLISCISSLLAGKICYKSYNPSLFKFFMHGFFNLFTLLGFILMSYIIRSNRNYIDNPLPAVDSSNTSRPAGVLLFSLTFSAFFLSLNVALCLFMVNCVIK